MPAPQSTWSLLGYESTPYSTEQIQTNDGGERLLVGRSAELEQIHTELVNGVQLIALEGDYGVGKSSLAAVAAHISSQWYDDGTHLFVPAITSDPLELQDGESLADFQKRVYFRIAAAIINRSAELERGTIRLHRLEEFKAWLKEPSATGWSIGIGASLMGVGGGSLSGGRSRAPNTSVGFTDAGVIALVDSWLVEISAGAQAGGVICVLDNLENLNHFKNAFTVFQSLRDSLFRKPGLIWIVCGAEGMVRTAFSSKKMAGVFHEPIDIPPLPSAEIPNVIRARAETLKRRTDAILPVSPEAFGRLYESTGRNLRFALGIADSYASRTPVAAISDLSLLELDEKFFAYLRELGDRVVSDLPMKVTPADWKVLQKLVAKKAGTCSPSEYADFGYADMPPLIVRVKQLEKAGLVNYTVVREDARRRIMSATENGRLVLLGTRV